MTRRRKLALIAEALVALAVTIVLCWPKPRGYTYRGKTVEEWFKEFNASYSPGPGSLSPENLWKTEASVAFREMGTNAAPFLAMRIMDTERSLIEKWRWQLPEAFHPKPHRISDATHAAVLLAHCAMCPAELLRELLKPALAGTNSYEKQCAMYATNSYVTNSFGYYEGRATAESAARRRPAAREQSPQSKMINNQDNQ